METRSVYICHIRELDGSGAVRTSVFYSPSESLCVWDPDARRELNVIGMNGRSFVMDEFCRAREVVVSTDAAVRLGL
jgi:hypothetical protein